MKKIWLAAALMLPSLALAEKPAAAPPAGAMQMPKPAPELELLKPLAGTWSCDGKAPEMGSMPAHAYKSTFTDKWELNNFWMSMVYDVKKSKENPMAFEGKGWIGWDAAAKKLVMAGVDGMGGWISLTATGWEGDKLVFSGDMMGPMGKGKGVFTFTKGKSPSELTFDMTGTDPSGKPSPVDTAACKKK